MTGHIVPLALPCPPTLLEALGYTGDTRYVAVYWSRYGDEAVIYDGLTIRAASRHAWLAFVNHAATRPVLGDHNLGAADVLAECWLLADRLTQQLAVGRPDAIIALLRGRPDAVHSLATAPPDTEMPIGEMFDYVRAVVSAAPPATWLEAASAGHHARTAEAALITWLDRMQSETLTGGPRECGGHDAHRDIP